MATLFEKLKTYLGMQGDSEDELLTLLADQAEYAVLNRRYPFGYTDTERETALLSYSNTGLDIAVYLYNKRGAEGQIGHSEIGIGRSYESAGIPESYLQSIVPVAKAF